MNVVWSIMIDVHTSPFMAWDELVEKVSKAIGLTDEPAGAPRRETWGTSPQARQRARAMEALAPPGPPLKPKRK